MKIAVALLICFAAEVHAAMTENVVSTRDATQTYTLVLPSGYSADRKWPVLLVFDPRMRGTFGAELFREAAEEYGWIVLSSNNAHSDAGWDPNVKAMDAMVGELPKYSIDPRRIYAAGFSGMATVAWVLVKSKQFAGVINAGQPYQDHLDAAHASFAVWGSAGIHDFNNVHVRRIDAEVERSGRPHRIEIFEGAHRWMPPELARAAIEWHDLQAMRAGLRPRDVTFIDRVYQKERERAASTPDELLRLRRYESLRSDFEGLRDTSEAERAAAGLREAPRVRSLMREERNADEYERRELENVITRMRAVLASRSAPFAAVREMRLSGIVRDAADSSYRGAAARRVLETLLVQTAFYLPEKYFLTREYDKAAIVLAIATSVRPERADLHYHFARALARSGRTSDALNALERAIQPGVKKVDPRTESDFKSLRGIPRFDELIARGCC
jgi:dienelactone hydrolase